MILICPNCETRYMVADSAIGETGRKVKCTHCDNEWYQGPDGPEAMPADENLADAAAMVSDENTPEGDTDDSEKEDIVDFDSILDGMSDDDDLGDTPIRDAISFDEDETDEEGDDADDTEEGSIGEGDLSDDIPDSVKPNADDDIPSIKEKKQGGRLLITRKAASFILFLILAGSVTALFVMKDTVIEAFPPSLGLYSAVGLSPEHKGEGLIIDRVVAETKTNDEGAYVLEIQGYIVNVERKDIDVPAVDVILRSEDGEVYDGWEIAAPAKRLKPGAEVKFSSSYPNIQGHVAEASVGLSFQYNK